MMSSVFRRKESHRINEKSHRNGRQRQCILAYAGFGEISVNGVLCAFVAVGMSALADKSVNKLSGGQKQRVAIARAIVNSPQLLLADEPTGALDSTTSEEIMELFHQLHNSGITIVIVTHDLKIAQQCERIIEISDGKII